MKKLLCLFTLLILSTVFIPAPIYGRTWTSANGRQIKADFVSFDANDSNTVRLKIEKNGKVYPVKINTLSSSDQEYIQTLRSEQPQTNRNNNDPFADSPADSSVSPKLNSIADSDNPDVKIAVCEGMGETIAEAKKDALRSAVELVVGSLVDARTRVENDEVIEQILTASNAYVESHKVLKARGNNGVFTVTVEARVVKSAITGKIRSGGSSMSIDGASLAGKAGTKVESEKSGALFLANFLKQEKFPYSLYDLTFAGTPSTVQKGNDIQYTVGWNCSVNLERYQTFVDKITPILDKLAITKGSFVLNLKNEENGEEPFYSYNQIPGYEGKNIILSVCTTVSGDFRSLGWKFYELPKKYLPLLKAYEALIPSIECTLIDAGKKTVSAQRTLLQWSGYKSSRGRDAFNCSPALLGSFSCFKIELAGESTIVKIDSYYHELPFYTIAPYQRLYNDDEYDSSKYNIRPKCLINSVFSLSPSELERVRSAKLEVIVNNPEMDKVYANLEAAMDKIPTE